MEKNIDRFPLSVVKQKETVGMQMQVFKEQQIEAQKELETETELELEHMFYQKQGAGEPLEEVGQPNFFSPSALLQKEPGMYKMPYHKLFIDSEFVISENFAYTEKELLPIFSEEQKPALQIYVEKGLLFTTIKLLSAQEGSHVKTRIKGGMEGCWLYLPDGNMHVDSIRELNKATKEKLQRVLIDVNILNGDVVYLLKNKEGLQAKIGSDPEMKKLLFRFLALKTFGNLRQTAALNRLKGVLEVQ
jgi:hypothetical protein